MKKSLIYLSLIAFVVLVTSKVIRIDFTKTFGLKTPKTKSRSAYKAAIETVTGRALVPIQVDSLDKILSAWEKHGDGDGRKLTYILATAIHESFVKPIKEIRAKVGTELRDRQNRYWLSGYYGRGFVQLTWKSNYEKFSRILGIDLVGNPDLALGTEVAAFILVKGMMDGLFTGRALSDYIDIRTDYYNARRTVNGTDRADRIKGYAETIENHFVVA